MVAALVVTPAALLDRYAERCRAAHRELKRQLPDCAFVSTRSPDDARAHIHTACAARSPLIVVLGGDGAINCALEALRTAPIPIDALSPAVAVVPMGTANDLARLMYGGVTQRPKLDASARRIRHIDVITVNGKAFCTTGGVGLPSAVVGTVERRRSGGVHRHWVRRCGSWVYALIGTEHVLRGFARDDDVTLSFLAGDGGATQIVRARASAVFVSNQRLLAGGLEVAPAARNDDGVFDVTMVQAGSRARMLRVLARMVLQQPQRDGDVVRVRARQATLVYQQPQQFFGDGETLARSRTFELAVEPGALRLVC